MIVVVGMGLQCLANNPVGGNYIKQLCRIPGTNRKGELNRSGKPVYASTQKSHERTQGQGKTEQ